MEKRNCNQHISYMKKFELWKQSQGDPQLSRFDSSVSFFVFHFVFYSMDHNTCRHGIYSSLTIFFLPSTFHTFRVWNTKIKRLIPFPTSQQSKITLKIKKRATNLPFPFLVHKHVLDVVEMMKTVTVIIYSNKTNIVLYRWDPTNGTD